MGCNYIEWFPREALQELCDPTRAKLVSGRKFCKINSRETLRWVRSTRLGVIELLEPVQGKEKAVVSVQERFGPTSSNDSLPRATQGLLQPPASDICLKTLGEGEL